MYDQLRASLDQLLAQLPQLPHGQLIARSLSAIAAMAENPELERLDWKLIDGCLQDMQKGIKVLHPFRHIRKVSIFGSARTPTDTPEYEQAQMFAREIANLGFLVFTGAGNGIMAASNQGAGLGASFGLNINLPFEQSSNPFVASDRLVSFKYFFTRKLFFLKESDAVAIFPGGFGTQDELFECLTLCQTGKATPRPIVLLEPPSSNYWEEWSAYVDNHLLCRDLISPGDRFLYRIFKQIEPACEYIQNFYSCYHSSRWVGELLVLRLNYDISDPHLAELNRQFQPLLTQGQIYRTDCLPEEQKDTHLLHLPRLAMYFNQRDYGSLQKLIEAINNEQMASELPLICHVPAHPEQK